MRYILTCLLLFVACNTHAQFEDNFSDGDFLSNPIWSGDDTNFEIDSNNKLHLLAPAVSDTSYLATTNNLMNDAEWTFKVDLDFGTSSANLAKVYLVSDQSDLTASLNGYFVMVGNTNDEVSLYRQDGLGHTEIIDGVDGFINSNPVEVRVKVIRDLNGNWTLLADNTGGVNYTTQGQILDITYATTSYFGVYCKYTSTRSEKFYFDDFKIVNLVTVDTILPEITGLTVTSVNELSLTFSELITTITAENLNNYIINNGIGLPVSAQLLFANPQTVELSFQNAFQDGVIYELIVQNVEDDSGNIMLNDTLEFSYSEPVTFQFKDVLITEVMVDPNPVINLEDAEYIELYNRSNHIINLNGWAISDASTSVTISMDYLLSPNEYVLLTQDGLGSAYGVFNTIELNLPAFNNGEDAVTIIDTNNVVIDSIYYDESWYKNTAKSSGGWSLELKNIESPCQDRSNWSASENLNGGTPGVVNSINTIIVDTLKPRIIEVLLETDSTIRFLFDRSVGNGVVTLDSAIQFQIDSLTPNEVLVNLSSLSFKTIYEIEISHFSDCWGNMMLPFYYKFGRPELAEKGDIILNEVLFNPVTNGSDYIEIVNVSDKILSLKNWSLGNKASGEIDNLTQITPHNVLLFPAQYKVITEDSLDVINNFPLYKSGQFFETDIPTYNNDSGSVVLLDGDQMILDQFTYSEDLHFKLLKDLNGKALERLSFDLPTQSEDNWHTASELVGWGSPGYENSKALNCLALMETYG